jgi:hypothetical protein
VTATIDLVRSLRNHNSRPSSNGTVIGDSNTNGNGGGPTSAGGENGTSGGQSTGSNSTGGPANNGTTNSTGTGNGNNDNDGTGNNGDGDGGDGGDGGDDDDDAINNDGEGATPIQTPADPLPLDRLANESPFLRRTKFLLTIDYDSSDTSGTDDDEEVDARCSVARMSPRT